MTTINPYTKTDLYDSYRMVNSAVGTLKNLGFEYKGGTLWQPPLGKAPYYLKDVPKYVTFNAEEDPIGVWSTFTHNKDYKVLNVYDKGYIVENDLGTQVKIAKTFFYPEPTREELLPSKVDAEEESSFDSLVRSDYVIQEGDYFVINKLSEEQKKFLSKELPVYGEGFFSAHYNHCYYDYEQEFVACSGFGIEGKELSFNLLFVEKSS